jgi:hypothetical protein
MFTDEKKKELIEVLDKRLKKRGTQLRCPMCSQPHFSIADAYIRNELQPDLKAVNLGGPSIPTIAIVCSNCGFLSQHAIGVLGLLSVEENKNA